MLVYKGNIQLKMHCTYVTIDIRKLHLNLMLVVLPVGNSGNRAGFKVIGERSEIRTTCMGNINNNISFIM